MSRLRRAFVMIVMAPLALAGCGSSGTGEAARVASSAASQASTAGVTTAAPTTAVASTESRCLEVPTALREGIASGAESSVGRLTITEAAAVKSTDYSEVFMIAGRFTAPGVDDEVGVWASNSLEAGGGLIIAVDGFAKQFTTWPDGDKSSAGIRLGDDGVDEAKVCL